MSRKKLAVLLAAAVMVGPIEVIAAHLAQATSQSPRQTAFPSSVSSPSMGDPLQVASVNDRSDRISGGSSTDLSDSAEASELYTIAAKPGSLKTLIQVLPHAGDDASLFVNGSEVLRFHGTVNDQTAHERVSRLAGVLHQKLLNDAANGGRIRPDRLNKDSLLIGDAAFMTVDACTASAAQEQPQQLAFLYANRLRRALGQPSLTAPATPQPHTPDAASTETAVAAANPYKSKTGAKRQFGVASWYGGMFHGRRTASGKRFNQYALTAAHRTLPFGTLVRVTNQRNHKSCVVQITDRGPYAHGRIIDLSKGAAQAIGMPGVSHVALEIVTRD